MNRDEFEKLLIEFSNAAAGSWRMNTIAAYNKASNDLLAEFDRLQAEMERLRWHRPDLGEFPDVEDEFVNIIVEYVTDVIEIDVVFKSTNKKVFFERIKRWRYIE
jgi:hypothetical protein